MPTGTGAYELLHGVLYLMSQGVHRVYVPIGTAPSGKSLRHVIISDYHDSPIAGHFGSVKCVAALNQHYYWSLKTEGFNYKQARFLSIIHENDKLPGNLLACWSF